MKGDAPSSEGVLRLSRLFPEGIRTIMSFLSE